MEYISVEEFLKQPKEVQKVFINWWKPNKLDSISFILDDFEGSILYVYTDKQYVDVAFLEENEIKIEKKNKSECIPLLSEGQVRKFIEDKTTGLSSMKFKCNEIRIDIYDNNKVTFIKTYEKLGNDLLQAYWKVACQIASKEVIQHGQTK